VPTARQRYGFTHQEIADLIGVSAKTLLRITNLAFLQVNYLLKNYGAADL